MKKIVIVALVMAVLVASGVLALKTKNMDDADSNKATQKVTSDPTMKPVTKDDSFTSIDSDINNTVILQEDFSDL